MTLHTPTRDDAADPTAPYVVRVLAKRCGGAITTASGVLVGGGLVVTTVHAVESVARRVRVQMATSGSTRRYPAMIQYLDVDDDIAVLRVPGLEDAGGISRLADATSTNPSYGFALGIDDDGRGLRRVPIVLGGERLSATIEQPDGFGREITDRDVLPMLGGISTGFSGAPVVLSQSGDAGPWLLAGIVRARIPFRALTGSVVIPVELINEAIDARGANPEWSELVPNPRCSQWARLQS